MNRRGRIIAAVLVGALIFALPLPHALADHDDGVFELPSSGDWDHADLSVLIVPPAHGQIFNPAGGVLNGGDPNELTTSNSYLHAVEAAIKSWDDAVEMFGADWLGEVYNPTTYVLGRDPVPNDVLVSPDILVVTDENEGGILGTAIWARTGYVRTPCIVRMSMSEFFSFSYADMYNVTAQEYGHCLGLNHVGSQGGVDPTSDQKHPEHDVMNGFYTHMVGAADTHLHCVSNLDVKAMEHVFDHLLPSYKGVLNGGVRGITYMPESAYGDMCAPPPSDWRERTPATLHPNAPPMGTKIEQPLEGSSLRASDLKRVSGSVFVDQSKERVPYSVHVALAKVEADGSCSWWADGDWISRDCYSPAWSPDAREVKGAWRWKTPKGLSPGNYRVLSRVLTTFGKEQPSGDNVVDFKITSSRR